MKQILIMIMGRSQDSLFGYIPRANLQHFSLYMTKDVCSEQIGDS